MAVEFGADAIGLNFVSRSKRAIDLTAASSILCSVHGQIETVGVVEHMSLRDAASLRDTLRLDKIQFHDGAALLNCQAWPAWAYVAIGIAEAQDVDNALHCPGDRVLVDSRVGGTSGGLGLTFDWSLVRELATERRIILAGGLTPDNVASAIQQVSPCGVDTASGVELPGKPRHKDPELMRRFIENARAASGAYAGKST